MQLRVEQKGGLIEILNWIATFNVTKRELRDKLLVGVQNNDSKTTDLFVSDKRGNHLKKLVTVPFAADWHIDVKNSKLRVIHQTGKGIRIENFTW